MNIAVWTVSGLLAALYVVAGSKKLSQPITVLRKEMAWVDEIPFGLVRFIGAVEIVGALGLVLPKLLDLIDDRAGIEGTLTGLAATGLLLIQVLAIPVHARRGEYSLIGFNVVLGAGAGFVALGRFGWL